MLVDNEELYEHLEAGLRSMHMVVHAVYEPDYGDFYGDCYCAAVDMFAPGITFWIYFRFEEDELRVEHVERYYMG